MRSRREVGCEFPERNCPVWSSCLPEKIKFNQHTGISPTWTADKSNDHKRSHRRDLQTLVLHVAVSNWSSIFVYHQQSLYSESRMLQLKEYEQVILPQYSYSGNASPLQDIGIQILLLFLREIYSLESKNVPKTQMLKASMGRSICIQVGYICTQEVHGDMPFKFN